MLLLTSLEEAVAAQVAAQSKLVEGTGPAKDGRAAATAAAMAAAESEAADVAKKEAESAVKVGETAVKDAKKALNAVCSFLKSSWHVSSSLAKSC